MRLYLAGPMTGIPRFNYPAFDRAACALRAEGFDVLSPAEVDPPAIREASWRSATGNVDDLPGFMPAEMACMNVEHLTACNGVALLDGWQRSSGARHEVETAHRLNLPVAPIALWLMAAPRLLDPERTR